MCAWLNHSPFYVFTLLYYLQLTGEFSFLFGIICHSNVLLKCTHRKIMIFPRHSIERTIQKQPPMRTLTLQYCSTFPLFVFLHLHHRPFSWYSVLLRSAVINALRNPSIQTHSHSLSIILWINRLRHWGISVEILQNAMRSFTPRSHIFLFFFLFCFRLTIRNFVICVSHCKHYEHCSSSMSLAIYWIGNSALWNVKWAYGFLVWSWRLK